jgi:hypothetical protein
LLLKAFAYQGRFPRDMHELPGAVIVHVADQVGVQVIQDGMVVLKFCMCR